MSTQPPLGGAAGAAGAASTVVLDLVPRAGVRRNARLLLVGAVVFAAAVGGVVGLAFGRVPGLVAAAVVLVPLLLGALADVRRRTWLDGAVVHRRALGTRRVDIRRATGLEVIVTTVRGKRTVSILLAGPPRTGLLDKGINVGLATYTATGGVELNVLALRKLADEFAEAEHSSGLVYSELLVAQLRAEARGAPPAERPLVQIAAAVGDRGVVRRIPTDALVRFVGGLDEPGETGS